LDEDYDSVEGSRRLLQLREHSWECLNHFKHGMEV